MKLKEKDIERQILTWLKLKGIFCWKQPSSGYYDTNRKCFRRHASGFVIKGVSDVLGICRGKFLAIEIKSESGRVSVDQERFLEHIREEGGIAFVARSVEDCVKNLTL